MEEIKKPQELTDEQTEEVNGGTDDLNRLADLFNQVPYDILMIS